MNKVLLVGRIVRDPYVNETSSGIKYVRFTVAVNRPFGENQTDFIPVVAWRAQAEFIEKYLGKGSLVSIDGRFTSSLYEKDGQTVNNYEVTIDRLDSLESKKSRENRIQNENFTNDKPQVTKFEEEESESSDDDIPWDLEL